MPRSGDRDAPSLSNKFSNSGRSMSCRSLDTASWCHTSYKPVKRHKKTKVCVYSTNKIESALHQAPTSHRTECNLRSCERPRLIIWGVMVELRLRFPNTSSSNLSVFTGEWVELLGTSCLRSHKIIAVNGDENTQAYYWNIQRFLAPDSITCGIALNVKFSYFKTCLYSSNKAVLRII